MDQEKFIEQLVDLEERSTAIQGEKTKLINDFKESSPDGLAIKQNEDGTWTRVTVTDNKEKIDEGFWKMVKVERFSVKIDNLKNKPKELS